MNRLRVQLVLAFTLVVLVAVGAIAVLIIRTTNTQFRQYITNSSMTASGSGLEQLIAYYEAQGSWDGVDSLLEQGVSISGPWNMPVAAVPWHSDQPTGPLDVTLADATGRVVYDSAGETEGKKLKSGDLSQALPITSDDGETTIGYLLLSGPPGAAVSRSHAADPDHRRRPGRRGRVDHGPVHQPQPDGAFAAPGGGGPRRGLWRSGPAGSRGGQ
jgi:hypothetical protein